MYRKKYSSHKLTFFAGVAVGLLLALWYRAAQISFAADRDIEYTQQMED